MAKAPIRKKVKKDVSDGIAHIHASFNNTHITITDTEEIDYRDPRVLSTVLLYDVESVTFSYRRNPNRSGETNVPGSTACYLC